MKGNKVWEMTFGKVKATSKTMATVKEVAELSAMGAIAGSFGNRLHAIIHNRVLSSSMVPQVFRDYSKTIGDYGLSSVFGGSVLALALAGLTKAKLDKKIGIGYDLIELVSSYMITGGTVAAAYNMTAATTQSAFAGVDFTPMQGIDFTPMQGVDFTPMGAEESPADFGGVDFTPMGNLGYIPLAGEESPADFGFEEGSADFGAEESPADFGMYDEY